MHAEAATGSRTFGGVPEEAFSPLAAGRCLVAL